MLILLTLLACLSHAFGDMTDSVPSLPASAIVEQGQLPSERDAAMLKEVRKALDVHRDFMNASVPGGPIGFYDLRRIASFKAFVDKGGYCGEPRRAVAKSLAGAATLLYVQRLKSLASAEKELRVADAAVSAAKSAAREQASAAAAAAESAQKKAKAAVDPLRLEVDSLQNLLLRNGWAKPASTFGGLGSGGELELPIEFDTDYDVPFSGKC